MDTFETFLAALVLGTVVLFFSLVLSGVVALFGAWVVMVALGDLHTQFPVVPALGYIASFFALSGVVFVGTLLRPAFSANTQRGQG